MLRVKKRMTLFQTKLEIGCKRINLNETTTQYEFIPRKIPYLYSNETQAETDTLKTRPREILICCGI